MQIISLFVLSPVDLGTRVGRCHAWHIGLVARIPPSHAHSERTRGKACSESGRSGHKSIGSETTQSKGKKRRKEGEEIGTPNFFLVITEHRDGRMVIKVTDPPTFAHNPQVPLAGTIP